MRSEQCACSGLVVLERRRPAGEVGDGLLRGVVDAVRLRDADHLSVVEYEDGVPVRCPLDENQAAQVTEDGVDEDHLGYIHPLEGDVVLCVSKCVNDIYIHLLYTYVVERATQRGEREKREREERERDVYIHTYIQTP